MQTLSVLFLSIALGAASNSVVAAEPVPTSGVIGKFGFGYGPNLPSKCRPISKGVAAKFDKCEWENIQQSSYAQKSNYYICEIKKTDDEYKIYPSKARCLDELGTMNANAP